MYKEEYIKFITENLKDLDEETLVLIVNAIESDIYSYEYDDYYDVQKVISNEIKVLSYEK